MIVTACEMFQNTRVPSQAGKDMVLDWIGKTVVYY